MSGEMCLSVCLFVVCVFENVNISCYFVDSSFGFNLERY